MGNLINHLIIPQWKSFSFYPIGIGLSMFSIQLEDANVVWILQDASLNWQVIHLTCRSCSRTPSIVIGLTSPRHHLTAGLQGPYWGRNGKQQWLFSSSSPPRLKCQGNPCNNMPHPGQQPHKAAHPGGKYTLAAAVCPSQGQKSAQKNTDSKQP